MSDNNIPEIGEDEPVRAPVGAGPTTVRTTKRSDAAQAFIQSWLSGHPVPANAFTDADAVALIKAIDATK